MQLTRGSGSLWVAHSHRIRDMMWSRGEESGRRPLAFLVEASGAAQSAGGASCGVCQNMRVVRDSGRGVWGGTVPTAPSLAVYDLEVFKLFPMLLLIAALQGLTKTRDQITSRAHCSCRSTLGCACLILAHGIRSGTRRLPFDL